MKAGLAIALVTVLLFLASPAGAWNSSSVVDQTASWLAQRKVSVYCLTEAEAEADPIIGVYGATAYVPGWRDEAGDWHPFDYTVVDYGICETLVSLSAYSVEDAAWALLVLTHEAGHLRGHRWSADEAKTECWAIRHVGYVAHHFGVLDADRRRAIVRAAVAIHEQLPPVYQMRACKVPNP